MKHDVVTFTVSKSSGKMYLTCYKPYTDYNVYDIEPRDLYKEMCKLTSLFNNTLGLAVLFEVD